MSVILENKLSNLINEIKEIKKELILQELKKTRVSKRKTTTWKMLGKKVSSKWNNISVIEEINQQREKS